jgi:hypothetical protein
VGNIYDCNVHQPCMTIGHSSVLEPVFSIQSTLCNILLSFVPWPPAKRDSQYIQITVFNVRKWSAISTGLHISPSWCPYFKYGAASKVWSGTCMESYGRGWQHTMYCISIHELVILDINWHVSSSLTRADSEFHRQDHQQGTHDQCKWTVS